MKHGVPGYQLGCRCAVCGAAESERICLIGQTEKRRWQAINRAADLRLEFMGSTESTGPRTLRKRWSETEIALALQKDLTASHVANRVGRSVGAVIAMRSRLAERARLQALLP